MYIINLVKNVFILNDKYLIKYCVYKFIVVCYC